MLEEVEVQDNRDQGELQALWSRFRKDVVLVQHYILLFILQDK